MTMYDRPMARSARSTAPSERESAPLTRTSDNRGYVTISEQTQRDDGAEHHDDGTEGGLSVAEVAFLTGRNPYVVRRWIREGVLPAHKAEHEQGQPWRVRTADLALIVRRRRWGGTVPPAVPHRLAAVASIAGAWDGSSKEE
jgi:hypothetical protein